jgi:formate dehydrogenase subunit gamma
MRLKYSLDEAASIIAAERDRPGALLPIFHALQGAFGYISPESVGQIAEALNLSRAEVYGVLTFYPHFRTTSPPRHIIRICSAEACQSMGSVELIKHVQEDLAGRNPGEYEFQPIYCLGLCANAPAMMLDETLHAQVTPEKFDRIIRKIGGVL